ncbi:recombinase RecT [Marinobacter sp. MDS2]|uniref:recombinase RecT n=1 Tax=Marinobacter sp. MDS2 TaxID=3065961 RepID=UPI00273CCA4F|nr:recombinase RecT [Marinobacter sp. MDS2]MDP4546525.1 recombinase RecT [Marinobacter sp. MDS2]
MSNQLEVIQNDIYLAKGAFEAVATENGLNFDREAGFAIQAIQASPYMLGVAMKNRQSVYNSVTNIAAIGISLNPAKKQAYLVPRDGKVCLDISYIGLMDLAMATGSIRWAQAEVVHDNDTFFLNGMDRTPSHSFDPFSADRGEPKGVYVVVKTADGDYLTETMSIAEINAIRDRSSAWKAWVDKKKSCPWVTDWPEMAKKTVVKRAYKYWPKTERLDQAIHYLNTDGGQGIELSGQPEPAMEASPWAARAEQADSTEALTRVWNEGVKALNKSGDLETYKAFREAVKRRGDDLKKLESRTYEGETVQ